MKKWIVTISAALSTLDLFWKDRIEKRPDSAKEEEMFGGKIRIRKVHNYGFALGMLSGEDRLVKGGSLGAGILLLIYYMKLLFSKKGKYWVLFLKHIYLIIKSSMNNAGLPLL